MAPRLPQARGPVSRTLLRGLAGPPSLSLELPRPASLPRGPAVLDDDDVQLALYVCYELHYRGFAGVDPRWEWAPPLLALRGVLEERFEESLRDLAGHPPGAGGGPSARPTRRDARPEDVAHHLVTLAAEDGGPSLSGYMARRGTLAEMAELCVHRSAYQLKEADPHTWVIPRLAPGSKAAVTRIQHDEYGAGRRGGMHAVLFSRTMRALGLDPSYGAYLDRIPGVTLATVNLISLLGLHRRHRGRLVGHLALFEMTSVGPMSRYAAALRRLGLGPAATEFYEVHVVADEEHSRVALEEMVASLLAEEPDLGPDVVEGAGWLQAVEGGFARHVLDSWTRGTTSLKAAASLQASA